MKKHFFVIAAIIFIAIIGLWFTVAQNMKRIEIIKAESYFHEFEVIDDTVYIRCYATIKNTFKEDKTIAISASFPEDVKNGLLKFSELDAYDADNEKEVFTIPKKSQQSFNIVFVGESAGGNTKHDRLLPEMKITIVD